ncbi:MAG: translation initiation factor IF-3 [Candidatus Aminicenantes bacterium]|nr:translation initiation factor IF-3 [Candidatus Aminicenantes bacterium]
MKYYRPRRTKRPHCINKEIRADKVRLIDENKTQVGIVTIKEALDFAQEKELDLVEISPKANPPVCRILNYGKFLYSLQKKTHEAQKQQRKIHIKEIKFTPAIGDHDIEVKLKKIKQFLEDGDKVKVTIWLRGRQKRKPEMLEVMTKRIINIIKNFAEIESTPRTLRFSCSILIGQKKGGKDAETKNP